MLEYINGLQWAARICDGEAAEFHDEAIQLPMGNERDKIARQWCLRRGEARGLEIALGILREYLQEHLAECQKALGERDE